MQMKLLLTLLLFSSFTGFSQDKKKIKIGDTALNFVGFDQNGTEIKLSDYRNKRYVLLNFTSIGCGYCWPTYNEMNIVQEKYKEELKVISFHHENEDLKNKWYEMAAKYKIDFKCTSIWNVIDKTNVYHNYNVPGWPYYFFIDKNGNILGKWWGTKGLDHLEKKLKKYMKKSKKSD
jgi:peroxiredoxin